MLAALALTNVPACSFCIPPAICRWLPIKEPNKWKQLRGHVSQFGEESGTGHAVVRGSAIQGNHDCVGGGVERRSHARGQCIRARPGLQGELEGSRGLLERPRPFLGERTCNQAPKHIARRYAAHAPVGFLERRQAGHGDPCSDLRGHLRIRKSRRGVSEEVQGFGILKQKF